MWERPAPRLAVAVLTESGGTAAAYRHRPDRPVQGYCLITGDEQQYRLILYIRNGRPLTGRAAHDRFYYEGWALAGQSPVSLGAFNTGDGGDGNGAFARPVDGLLIEQATLVRVTAEPFGGSQSGHTPVLEGHLVWIQGRPEAGGAAAPEALVPEAVLAAAPHAPWAGLLAGAGQPVATLVRAEAAAERSDGGGGQPEPEPEPEPQPAPELHGAAEPEPLPEPAATADPAPADEPIPEGPVEHPFKLVPEPATLVSASASEAKVPLQSLHPLAPRAGGSARFQGPDGGLQVTLWGLPAPASLGREKSTNRPYNTYRVWLQNPRTGQRTPLGLAARTWGENYRFDTEEPLPDTGYSTLLVTAHDRDAEHPDPGAPQVVAGEIRSV